MNGKNNQHMCKKTIWYQLYTHAFWDQFNMVPAILLDPCHPSALSKFY